MIKKFPAVYLFMLLFSLSGVNEGFAQVKKPVVKKAVAKKPVINSKPIPKAPEKTIANINTTAAVRIKITTDSGIFIIRLSDSTPLHRDNFVKLAKEGFYDSLLFHRVIPEFMIQGGDPSSKYAPAGNMLGSGGDYLSRIPAEFNKTLYHKKGVLAAARDGNPEKASSACQFYIVEGKKYTDDELNMLEERKGLKYTPVQRDMYKTLGGTPFLDQEYTVFGEVESGMEIINKISNLPKDGVNRPLKDIRMKVEVLAAVNVL